MLHVDLSKATRNKTPIFIQHETGQYLDIKLTDNGDLITVDDLILVASNEKSRYRLQAEGENGAYSVLMDEVLSATNGTLLCKLSFKKGEETGVTGEFNIFITPNNIKYEPIIPESMYFELAVVGYGKAGLSVVGKVLEV